MGSDKKMSTQRDTFCQNRHYGSNSEPSDLMNRKIIKHRIGLIIMCCMILCSPAHAQPTAFFEAHCYGCHDAKLKKGGLDLTALKLDADNFARWVKIHDRVVAGEMPPSKRSRRLPRSRRRSSHCTPCS